MKKLVSVVVFGLLLAACNGSQATEIPQSVLAQVNHPLPCDLLDEPRVVGDVTANYACRAPGAFLTEVDTSNEPWTAGYFTTDTQISAVTYGPEQVEVTPNPSP